MDSGIKYIEFEKKKTYIRPTCSKPNPLTKYMKSSTFESIKSHIQVSNLGLSMD